MAEPPVSNYGSACRNTKKSMQFSGSYSWLVRKPATERRADEANLKRQPPRIWGKIGA